MYVKTADCVGTHEHGRRLGDLTPYQYLLYVSAGQLPYGVVDSGSLYVQIFQYLLRKLFRALGIYEDSFSLVPGPEHHVPGHSHAADEAHAQSVFGNEGQGYSGVLDLHWGLSHKFRGTLSLRSIDYGALGDVSQACDGFQKFLLSRACDTGDSQYLSSEGYEAHVVESYHSLAVSYGKPCYRESRLRIHRLRSVYIK